MKRIFVIFLLLLYITQTACARSSPEQSPVQKGLYKVTLSSTAENQQFFKDIVPMQPREIKEDVLEQSYMKNFCLGEMSINANTVATQYIPTQGMWEVYSSKDDSVEYRKHQFSESFTIGAKDDGVLALYNGLLNEQNLIQFAQEYVNLYIKDPDFSKYTPYVSTFVSLTDESSAWGETKEYFYLANSKQERVVFYDIRFKTFSNGIATSDYINVLCDSSGNITWVKYMDCNTDWSVITINHKTVTDSLIFFFEQYMDDEYKLASYEMNSQSLNYNFEKNKIQLSNALTLNLETTNSVGEKTVFSTLCNVYIDIV